MTTIILFLAVLGVLVFVHELGHFLAARSSGVKVTEFGLGFPPRAKAFKPKNSEVTYSLNWLPIGGFVRIFGENYEVINENDPEFNRSFVAAKKSRQAFILVAGVLMNLIAAVFFFALAAWSGQLVPADVHDRDGFYVMSISPDSPAHESELRVGDQVISVGNHEVVASDSSLTEEEFSNIIASAQTNVSLSVLRQNQSVDIEITPQAGIIAGDEDRQALGVIVGSLKLQQAGFFEGISSGFEQTVNSLKTIIVAFASLISGIFTGASSFDSLTGPVGIAGLTNSAFQLGWGALFSFTAFLSLNLVIFNLLPIPALDGGRLLFVLIEAIKGSPVSSKITQGANLVGFGFLMLLMIAVTVQDIFRLF